MLDPTEFKIAHSAYLANKTVWVAYSGGIDSHVLLHLAHASFNKIRAVHINHGLSPNAASWQLHCQQICTALGVPLTVIPVTVHKSAQISLEDAARKARRAAWQQLLTTEDVLLVAHHAQDQAETILYRLCRGAGPQGLAGMQQTSKLGLATLYRPLLTVDKPAIIDYATRHALHWIIDESNTNQAFDRNYLRNTVLPVLEQRWPAVSANINRAGLLNRQLLECLQPTLQAKLHSMAHTAGLDLNNLSSESVAWQIEIIRAWLLQHHLQVSYQQVLKILREVVAARADARPQFRLRDKIVCRYRQYLILRNLPTEELLNTYHEYSVAWDGISRLTLPDGKVLEPREIMSSEQLQAKYPNAKWRVQAQATGRTAKKVFQQYAIPVWQRPNFPALYADETLVALLGLWVRSY